MKKTPFLKAGLAVSTILLAFLLTNCNSSSDKDTSKDTSSVKTDTINPDKKTMTVTKKAYPAYLRASELIDLLDSRNNNNTRKMIFLEFAEGDNDVDMILRAKTADNQGSRVQGIDIPLDTAPGPGVDFQYDPSNPYFNIIVRGHLKNFLGYTRFEDVAIPEKEFKKDILLTPCLNAGNKIEYILSYADVQAPKCGTTTPEGAGRVIANPSPPGSAACGTECDNPGFSFQ